MLMNILKKIGLGVLSLISISSYAQTDKETTAKIVNAKNFVFVANSAIPLNSTEVNKVLGKMSGGVNAGGNINLSGSNYDLKVTADSLVSYLPFYGRAYSAPFNNDDNGYRFTSKDFTYAITNRKKGGWDIIINTKDVKDNVRMSLNIATNGYATLSVLSNNKQSITFNGYLKEADKNSK